MADVAAGEAGRLCFGNWGNAQRSGVRRSGVCPSEVDWKKHVAFDERYLRPAEVDLLIGDASKAKKQLGWVPKVKFKELTEIMVDADIEQLAEERAGKRIRD